MYVYGIYGRTLCTAALSAMKAAQPTAWELEPLDEQCPVGVWGPATTLSFEDDVRVAPKACGFFGNPPWASLCSGDCQEIGEACGCVPVSHV